MSITPGFVFPRVWLPLALLLVSGCSTVIRPTRPDSPITQAGPAVVGFRFDGQETQLREPGLPLSPSRSWQREVANYTAQSLNTRLGTPDDAPTAQTTVSFDLASPSVIQIGTWKEMTIQLSSTLPDGSVVKSEPVIGHIDNSIEYALITAASIGGTALDATAAISVLLFVTFAPTPIMGAVALSALLGGIVLHVGQSVGTYVVAAREETRWSNLYAEALAVHAEDIRKRLTQLGGVVVPRAATKTPAPPSKDPADAPPAPLEDGHEL